MEIQRQIETLEKCVLILEEDKFYVRGICDVLRKLYDDKVITSQDFVDMKNLLVQYKPNPINIFHGFTKNEFWNEKGHNINLSFWWQTIFREPLTRQIRIDYLKVLIEFLKSK